VLFDAVVLPDGSKGVDVLLGLGQALEYAALTSRHGKTLLALGAGRALIEKAGVPTALGDGTPDPGVLLGNGDDKTIQAFIAAVAKHRHPQREGDPPRV
jgi:catalase